MATEDQSKLYKAFSFRVKDATSGKRLVALGNAVNTVWNYANEISARSAQRGSVWVGKDGLFTLTKGSGKLLDLPSQVVQAVVKEFVAKRKAAGRPKLRWRVSRGVRRSLGWVPFTNQDIKINGSVPSFAARNSGFGSTATLTAGSSRETSRRTRGAAGIATSFARSRSCPWSAMLRSGSISA
jgi:hypothetical protein